MKQLLPKLKSAIVTGLFIVLPAWLAILLLAQLVVKLGTIIEPITAHLPAWIDHPILTAIALVFVVCGLTGLLVHTRLGRLVGKTIHDLILQRIPGYPAIRNISNQLIDFESEQGFKPAFIDMEDQCLSPAFLIETHGNGLCTVFVPSVPTPLAGSILIMEEDRVQPIAIPVQTMLKCISKWGLGCAEILQSLEPNEAIPQSIRARKTLLAKTEDQQKA